MDNPNCDGSGPHTEGEVKVYPIGGDSNLILCHSCWIKENKFNHTRAYENRQFDGIWPMHNWYQAKVYTPGK